MDKAKRIRAEQDRLKSIFSELDENEMQVVEGLISQASFMLITLEDLQTAINENGSVGEYKNGKDQFGTKQSAELQAYNQTLRSYNAVIGKLLKIVPYKVEYIESPFEKMERKLKEIEEQKRTPDELYEEWHNNYEVMLQTEGKKEVCD